MNQKKLIKELGLKQYKRIVRDFYQTSMWPNEPDQLMEYLIKECSMKIQMGDLVSIVITGKKNG